MRWIAVLIAVLTVASWATMGGLVASLWEDALNVMARRRGGIKQLGA